MNDPIITGLLWFSAVGCGLMAGLYFAFSAFIMTALRRIEPAAGAAAMNSINSAILRSLFMPIFLGSSLASLILVGVGLLRWSRPGSAEMLGGGTLYVVGMFMVTMMFNVPLNNVLASADAASARGSETWSGYLRRWTAWNHVRTLASTGALALFIAAIARTSGS